MRPVEMEVSGDGRDDGACPKERAENIAELTQPMGKKQVNRTEKREGLLEGIDFQSSDFFGHIDDKLHDGLQGSSVQGQTAKPKIPSLATKFGPRFQVSRVRLPPLPPSGRNYDRYAAKNGEWSRICSSPCRSDLPPRRSATIPPPRVHAVNQKILFDQRDVAHSIIPHPNCGQFGRSAAVQMGSAISTYDRTCQLGTLHVDVSH